MKSGDAARLSQARTGRCSSPVLGRLKGNEKGRPGVRLRAAPYALPPVWQSGRAIYSALVGRAATRSDATLRHLAHLRGETLAKTGSRKVRVRHLVHLRCRWGEQPHGPCIARPLWPLHNTTQARTDPPVDKRRASRFRAFHPKVRARCVDHDRTRDECAIEGRTEHWSVGNF
jgi:hypothetical protein